MWDQSYQKDFAWYIPDMARDEVTEALLPMEIGDFIVYEQERDDPGSRLPSFVNAPVIQQFVNVPKLNTAHDADSDSDGLYADGDDAHGAAPTPIAPVPSKKMMPIAKRVQMQARVVRRGNKLGSGNFVPHPPKAVAYHEQSQCCPPMLCAQGCGLSCTITLL